MSVLFDGVVCIGVIGPCVYGEGAACLMRWCGILRVYHHVRMQCKPKVPKLIDFIDFLEFCPPRQLLIQSLAPV